MGFTRQLESDIRDRLLADPYFSDVPVFTTDNLFIPNEISRALGKISGSPKSGIYVVVQPTTRTAQWPNVSGPFYNEVLVDVTIEEEPTINRGAAGTGKPFDDVAERIAQILNLSFIPANCTSPMRPRSPTIDKPVMSGEAGGLPTHVSQACHFIVSGTTTLSLTQVAKPAHVNAGGTITLACATPGAAIFYTLDGSFPNPQTTLYTAPFAGAGLLRARAYLAGFLASDPLEAQLS